MGTKLKQNGIEFNDGTEQTTAATNTENFTDLQDTPRDFRKSVNGDLLLHPPGTVYNYGGLPVTYFGDTTNGRDVTTIKDQMIWDGNDTTYFSMPHGQNNGWKYPDESWILVTFQHATGGNAVLQTKNISKIILTTGPSTHGDMGGYTFGVYGIVNSAHTYGALEYSYSTPDGILQSHSSQTGIPAGEGVRKELLKGTVFGQTIQGDYLQPDYRIGTGYPHKCVWVLDTPVEVQHLEFRLSRGNDSTANTNLIGGIEIFDDADNKFVVRLNSDGTALELSDDHETRITAVENNVSTLDSDMTTVDNRVATLESRERYDVLIYTYFGRYDNGDELLDIRTLTTHHGETWAQILSNINLCYPPSVYGVGKRLIFKPHQYYSHNNAINAYNQYFTEYVYILTRGTASNGTPEWQLEHGGKATLISTLHGEQVNWNDYDGD